MHAPYIPHVSAQCVVDEVDGIPREAGPGRGHDEPFEAALGRDLGPGEAQVEGPQKPVLLLSRQHSRSRRLFSLPEGIRIWNENKEKLFESHMVQ